MLKPKPIIPATKHRQAIEQYLNEIEEFVSARTMAATLNLPYKAVIDALNALYNQGRITRRGRKYSAVWGALWLAAESLSATGWDSLAAVWFGGR